MIAFNSFQAKDIKSRRAAVKKITDQNLLAMIALNDKKHTVRLAAVNKITDQDLLVDISTRYVNRHLKVSRLPP